LLRRWFAQWRGWPFACVVTRPAKTRLDEAVEHHAGAAPRWPGVMITETALLLSEAADEGARNAAESSFSS